MLRDWRGAPINEGSLIVYPARHGSSMWVVEAEVLKIIEKQVDSDRVIPALRVRPIGATWTHRIAMKKVTLTALDRVTVVHPAPGDSPIAQGYCSTCQKFHTMTLELS